MCGIVGLLVKNPALRNQLGALMVPMLVGMTERGPDSAGLAVYTEPVAERQHKLSLYSGEHAVDWPQLLERITAEFQGSEISAHGNHAVLVSAAEPDLIVAWLTANAPQLISLSEPATVEALPAAAGSVGFPNAFYKTNSAAPANQGAVK